MTNLEQVSQLVSDALKLEGFNQEDIIEYQTPYMDNGKVKMRKGGLFIIGETLLLKDLTAGVIRKTYKLIQRKISLLMVLKAWYQKELLEFKERRDCSISKFKDLDYPYDLFLLDNQDKIIKLLILWRPYKNGKDCNLSDQSEELCKLIVEALK